MEAGIAPQSLQQKVRAAHQRAQQRQTYRVPIPETDGMLLGRYHPVDWERRLDIERDHIAEPDAKQQILLESADYLLAACDTIEAVTGGETEDLKIKLGLGLAEWLEVDVSTPEGPMSDRQALIATFADTGRLLKHAAAVRREQESEAPQAEDETVGESTAAS